ncbi:MAG: opacity family porin [Roseiarcus sp.]|jgi:opacity protein-like surface antigen
MAKLKALILAGGALFALARAAVAADLLPPAPALEPPPPAMAEFNGWYLRGDVGLGINATTPTLAVSPDPIAAGIAGGTLDAAATNGFYNPTVSASGIFDLGFGYQFNNWFRVDLTEEYRGGAGFQTLEVLNEPNIVGTNTSTQQYADFYRANLSSYVTMLNGYADLGTWYGVTPYVGAGAGFAYNKLFGFTDTGYAFSGSVQSPSGGYSNDGGRWNFAWGLMAGLSFNVTQNLKLDLGYRYLDYGKFTSGSSHCLTLGPPPGFGCGTSYTVYSKNDLASNDFRIGLRWMIGEEPTYAPPEAPLVRKY